MKLAIVTAVHGRPKITKAFVSSVKRIYQDFGIETFAAITQEWDMNGDEIIDPSLTLLTGDHMHVVKYKNKPVGEKFNQAVQLSKEHDWTHLMILGSDDIVSSRYIEKILTMGDKDFFGCDGLWFWGLNPRRAGFQEFGYFDLKGFVAGTGKVLSRRIIEECDYSPWPDSCNYGMDGKLNKRIKHLFAGKSSPIKYGVFKQPQEGTFIMDVKYTHHISSMSPITRRQTFDRQDPYVILPEHLPQEEYEYLYRLHIDSLRELNQTRIEKGQEPVEFKR